MPVIALYGGSFDPITSGHLILIFEVLNSQLCDQVWIMPSGDGRGDKRSRVKSVDRLRMCQLAVQDALGQPTYQQRRHDVDEGESRSNIEGFPSNCPIQVCDIEAREGFIPSYRLITRLESEYPQHQFRLIIGSDLIKQLHTWNQSKHVLQYIRFLIIPRIPYDALSTEMSTVCELSPSTSTPSSRECSSPITPRTSECVCGMIHRDFPIFHNDHPKHWQCLKCSMKNNRQWVMIESNIASTEIRKRLQDVVDGFHRPHDSSHDHGSNVNQQPSSSSFDQSNTSISNHHQDGSTKHQNDLLRHRLQMALCPLISPSVIQYIVNHNLYR